MNKECKNCKKEKEITEYYKDITHKDGYDSWCKSCAKLSKKQYREKTNYSVSVIEKICIKCNIKKSSNEFNKDKYNLDGLYPYCKTCRKTKSKSYYKENKEIIIEKVNNYYKNNREQVRITKRKSQKKQERTNPLFKLKRRLRNRLYYALKRKCWNKNTKFFKYIGCSLEELKIHIENKFINGMTWENHGKIWDIDHVKALSWATTEEELYKLCHYTNLQPLDIYTNRILKKDKII